MTTSQHKPTHKEKLFLKYYDKLIWQALYARAHLKLWERFEGYKSSYLKELKQAPHFFTLTIRAHLDDTLLTLSRILDRHKDSLSIWKFLNFVEQNLEIFSNNAFSQRKKGETDYYEYQVKSHTPITLKEIQEHGQKLGSLEQTINNLTAWRDKVIAHNDRKFYLEGKVVSREYPLRRQQLQEVVDTLFKILNRYSYAYKSSTFREGFSGEDDVQYVMNCIRFHIQEQNKQLEELKKQTLDKR